MIRFRFRAMGITSSFRANIRAGISPTSAHESATGPKLDRGATASSGDGLLWNRSSIGPQSKAKAYNTRNLGAAGFNGYSKSRLVTFSTFASTAPIASDALVPEDVLAFFTNDGNIAKLLRSTASVSSTAPTVK